MSVSNAGDRWTYSNSIGWEDDGIGNFRFRESETSGKASFGASNTGAERIFLIDTDQIEPFVGDLLGYGFWLEDGNLTRQELPDQHPFYRSLYAVSCEVEPFGKPG